MAEGSEVILNRMLNSVDPEYDTSDGSFFYDVLSPVAIQCNAEEEEQDKTLARRLIDTSTGDDLTANCSEEGVDRILATYATGSVTVKGTSGATVPQGERVASELIYFTFTETKTIPQAGEISVNVQCEQAGAIGNVPVGAIKSIPKTLTGISSVTNSEPTTGGYDQESDENLKERYYIKVRTPATSGNPYHYLQWARENPGVGGAKVVPLWDGRGTVKVVIINSDMRGADQVLIDSVHQHIEDNRPIGAEVTTISATEKAINISVNIAVDIDNYVVEDVQQRIINNITQYLKEIAFKSTYLSYAKIGAIILDSEGVIDYNSLLLNDIAENTPIGDEEVAILGGVAFG